MVNFPTRIPDCNILSPTLFYLFLSSDSSICSTMAFLHWEILNIFLSQLPLIFQQTQNGIPCLIT